MTDSYSQGLADEASLIHLLSKHHKVTASTKDENIFDDIDCYVEGTPVSIKTQHTAAKTGNLCFELRTRWRKNKEWNNSWYYNSKAYYYLVQVVDKVYRINTNDLHDYVDKHGWDKVTGNTQESNAEQEAIGHPHDLSEIGLISLDKLLSAEVAAHLAYLTREAPPKYRRTNI